MRHRPEHERMPSFQLAELLTGKVNWDDAQPAIRSWARFHIHDAAKQLRAMRTVAQRKAGLNKLPPQIRVMVEAEMRRLKAWHETKAEASLDLFG